MFVIVGRGLCDEVITRSEEFYRVCVSVCDLETSTVRRPGPKLGCCLKEIGEKQEELCQYFLTASCYAASNIIYNFYTFVSDRTRSVLLSEGLFSSRSNDNTARSYVGI